MRYLFYIVFSLLIACTGPTGLINEPDAPDGAVLLMSGVLGVNEYWVDPYGLNWIKLECPGKIVFGGFYYLYISWSFEPDEETIWELYNGGPVRWAPYHNNRIAFDFYNGVIMFADEGQELFGRPYRLYGILPIIIEQ